MAKMRSPGLKSRVIFRGRGGGSEAQGGGGGAAGRTARGRTGAEAPRQPEGEDAWGLGGVPKRLQRRAPRAVKAKKPEGREGLRGGEGRGAGEGCGWAGEGDSRLPPLPPAPHWTRPPQPCCCPSRFCRSSAPRRKSRRHLRPRMLLGPQIPPPPPRLRLEPQEGRGFSPFKKGNGEKRKNVKYGH